MHVWFSSVEQWQSFVKLFFFFSCLSGTTGGHHDRKNSVFHCFFFFFPVFLLLLFFFSPCTFPLISFSHLVRFLVPVKGSFVGTGRLLVINSDRSEHQTRQLNPGKPLVRRRRRSSHYPLAFKTFTGTLAPARCRRPLIIFWIIFKRPRVLLYHVRMRSRTHAHAHTNVLKTSNNRNFHTPIYFYFRFFFPYGRRSPANRRVHRNPHEHNTSPITQVGFVPFLRFVTLVITHYRRRRPQSRLAWPAATIGAFGVCPVLGNFRSVLHSFTTIRTYS